MDGTDSADETDAKRARFDNTNSSPNGSGNISSGGIAGYSMEKYLDPNRPFKCDVCKESFTQKNILLVHYNSVSHLHKLKRTMQEQQKKDQLLKPLVGGRGHQPHLNPPTMQGSNEKTTQQPKSTSLETALIDINAFTDERGLRIVYEDYTTFLFFL